jgi:hypothetical protein
MRVHRIGGRCFIKSMNLNILACKELIELCEIVIAYEDCQVVLGLLAAILVLNYNNTNAALK